jgi:hypothetical protein
MVEGDLLICCEPRPRSGRRRRGRQGECRDEHLGCLAGAEPAGERSAAVTAVRAAVRPAVLPGGIAAWTGSSSFSILSFLSPRC